MNLYLPWTTTQEKNQWVETRRLLRDWAVCVYLLIQRIRSASGIVPEGHLSQLGWEYLAWTVPAGQISQKDISRTAFFFSLLLNVPGWHGTEMQTKSNRNQQILTKIVHTKHLALKFCNLAVSMCWPPLAAILDFTIAKYADDQMCDFVWFLNRKT